MSSPVNGGLTYEQKQMAHGAASRILLARKVQKREDRKAGKRDPRITTSRFSWQEFVGMFLAIQAISVGMLLIVLEYTPEITLGWEAIASVMGYCALMALIVSGLTSLGRRFVLERPIRQMGVAASKVAQGDFDVLLPPLRKDDKKDYMDVMYDDFNIMVKELKSIETLKDDFVGNVSHEIKTPLATIESYARVLSKGELSDAERIEYTDVIVEASKRLSTLVSNILRLNKLENQGMVLNAIEYDLSEQLRNCILGLEPQWDKKGLIVEINIDDQCIINQDGSILELVWNNLISNAIKFTPTGGVVRVTQRADAAGVSIEVADSGCGMDEVTQKHIFDKFYQGDASHAQEGNGLGLALAARALKLVDAEMAVTSKPGEGSTFTVWLKNS